MSYAATGCVNTRRGCVRVTIFALVTAVCGVVSGGAAFGGEPVFEPEDFRRYPGLALAAPAAGTILSFVPMAAPGAMSVVPWVIYPTQLLAHLPLYGLDPAKALLYTGGELLLPPAGVGPAKPTSVSGR